MINCRCRLEPFSGRAPTVPRADALGYPVLVVAPIISGQLQDLAVLKNVVAHPSLKDWARFIERVCLINQTTRVMVGEGE